MSYERLRVEGQAALEPKRLPDTVLLAGDSIDVWRVRLTALEPLIGGLVELLSAEERERAERFHFASDRQAYVARRGVLRVLLGERLGVAPEAVRLETTARGKPRVQTDGERVRLHFSLSRSGPLALVAISDRREVGVDVERLREDFDYLPLAKLFLPVEELELLRELPPPQALARFFTLWTRMEACVKATGAGLAEALRPQGPRPWCQPLAAQGPNGLRVVDLAAAEGYRAALAAFGDQWQFREHTFDARRLARWAPTSP